MGSTSMVEARKTATRRHISAVVAPYWWRRSSSALSWRRVELIEALYANRMSVVRASRLRPYSPALIIMSL